MKPVACAVGTLRELGHETRCDGLRTQVDGPGSLGFCPPLPGREQHVLRPSGSQVPGRPVDQYLGWPVEQLEPGGVFFHSLPLWGGLWFLLSGLFLGYLGVGV